MNKYLLQILHEINTIIIPGLGALTVTNSKTGEIMFMGFLKHEDGNLAKYIVEKEGISENDAKNMIAKFVREIHIQLDKGDDYDMYQFGRFKKVNGEIEFENWSNYSNTDENNQITTDKSNEIDFKNELKVEEISPVETIINHKPLKEILEEKTEPSKLKSEEEKSSSSITANTREEIKPSKVEIEVQTESNLNTEKTIPKKEEKTIQSSTDTNKKTPEISNKPISKENSGDKQKIKIVEEKKKKSKGFYILIILLFLIAGGSVTTIIFYDKIEKAFFSPIKEKVADKIAENSAESDIENIEKQVELDNVEQTNNENSSTESISTETTSPKTESIEVSQNTGMTYHIIAGGFGVEANAEKLAKKYQSEGKNASVLGKFDELYLVAYESFATKEEATLALKSSAVKGWIFKYNK